MAAAPKLLFLYNLLIVNLQLSYGDVKFLPPLNFTIHPLSTPVNEKEPVVLDCQVTPPLRQCYWTRDSNQYRVTPGISQNYDNVGDKSVGDCSMRINKPTIDKDDGNWTCHVITNNDEHATSNPALLTVQRAPVVSLTKDSEPLQFRSVALMIGTNASETISCVASRSNPPARIFWLMEYDQLPSILETIQDPEGGKTFTVHSWPNILVTENHHQKTVRCQVTHPMLRQTVEKKFELHIAHPTTSVHSWVLENGSDDNRVTVHLGHPVFLHCQANGYPQPSYTWMRLDDSREFTIVNDGPTLLVGNNLEDEGAYKCTASNDINDQPVSANSVIHVKIEYAASNVTILLDTPVPLSIGSMVTLTCRANGYPVPEIRWLKGLDDLRIPISGGENLVFRNFTVTDQGLYQCTAFNTHNSKEIASIVIHLQIPGMEASLSSARHCSAQVTIILICIWILQVFDIHLL